MISPIARRNSSLAVASAKYAFAPARNAAAISDGGQCCPSSAMRMKGHSCLIALSRGINERELSSHRIRSKQESARGNSPVSISLKADFEAKTRKPAGPRILLSPSLKRALAPTIIVGTIRRMTRTRSRRPRWPVICVTTPHPYPFPNRHTEQRAVLAPILTPHSLGASVKKVRMGRKGKKPSQFAGSGRG